MTIRLIRFLPDKKASTMKLRINIVLLAMLTGCGHSTGPDRSNPSPNHKVRSTEKLTSKDVQQATGAGYISPAGARQECLGRLVFDVGQSVQWPTYINKDANFIFSSLFGEEVFDSGDGIKVQNMRIAVVGPTTPSTVKRAYSDAPWAKIERHKEYIDEYSAYAKRLRSEKNVSKRNKKDIADTEKSIRDWENVIKETELKYENFVLPVPDSRAFWKGEDSNGDGILTHSLYRAYLNRSEFTYIFESEVELKDEMTKERHKQQFLDIVGRFRPRKAGEIPTDLGVCFPYGFIADDGKMITDIKQSLRWEDAPGVIYSIQTGNVTERNTKSATIRAIGTAAAARVALGSNGGENAVLTHQVGPVLTRIGGLRASQGGFALRISNAGREPFDTYNVFTGYSGWGGSAVLPFILIEMSTRTMEQAPELKSNPPPFKQSMGRLETLLKSTRLRPTTPLMPDMAALNEKK
jgi:hypothetical protein